MGKKDKAKRESRGDGADFVDASVEERKAKRHDDSMHNERTAGGRAVPRGGGSVPSETVQYLEEVVAHFQTLPAAGDNETGEERMLLVGNVLEELAGKEVLVAGDQACSRHIETLLTGASTSQLLQLLTSIHECEGIQALSASPFGSHVLEKMLLSLEKGFASMSPEDYEVTQSLLTSIQQGVCTQLQAYSTDRFASHVARRLLCIAAGRDVMPPSKAQRQGQVAMVRQFKPPYKLSPPL
jgi:nucleolar protein 9